MAGQFAASLAHGMTEFEDEVEKGGQRVEGRERKRDGDTKGSTRPGGTTGQKNLAKDGNDGNGMEGNLSMEKDDRR